METTQIAKHISNYLKIKQEAIELWLNKYYSNSSDFVNIVSRALSTDKPSVVRAILNNERI